MSALDIVKQLKENEEDYEFYPTTKEIIESLYVDIIGGRVNNDDTRRSKKSISLLDIGAGNCKVFNTLNEISQNEELLPEWTYHSIANEEFYRECIIKKVLRTTDYARNYDVIIYIDDEEREANIDLDQFMIMLSNSNIEEIDFSSMPQTEDDCKYGIECKDYLLTNIKNYERKRWYRGNGEREANQLNINKYMVVEKSQTLINTMPKEAIMVGTDFDENTFIDKQADVVFCNPPYSEYAKWTTRIIKEANANILYFVIPQRWGSNRSILEAIKLRGARVTLIGKFDFLNSEDRKARAYVSLIKVDLKPSRTKKRNNGREWEHSTYIDPFDLWFNETFKINAKKSEDRWSDTYEEVQKREANIDNQIVNADDIVHTLVALYNDELNTLVSNYQKVGELDYSILKELNVDVDNLLKAFKEKIDGLKNLYWKKVFERFDEITSRLTSKSSESLMKTLTSNTNIDFTTGNIRSIVIWVIKNANSYFDSQMIDVYNTFTTQEGISLYKSNKKFVDDEWRYNKLDEDVKYALDYRIVLHRYRDEWRDRDSNKLSCSQMQYVKDIIVVAKNLGFNIDDIYGNLYLGDKENIYFKTNHKEVFKVGTKTLNGKIEEVFCHTNIPNENNERVVKKDDITYVYDNDNKNIWYQYLIGDHYYDSTSIVFASDIFTTVKGYKNGNVHFQFNKEFIKKLNLEVGRLRGWIKTPKEASEEFDISIEEATKHWDSNFTLLPANLSNLLPDYSDELINDTEPKDTTEQNQRIIKLQIETAKNGGNLVDLMEVA